MSGRQLEWQLLEELECPVCLQYMASPIKMCENGHNICEGCKERLSECPNCRGTFINVRNISLEKLAAFAKYPCKNYKAGCKETSTMDDRNKHLSVYLYRSKKCPVSRLPHGNCSWSGIVSDIKAHIEDKHAYDFPTVPSNFLMSICNLAKGMSYCSTVFILGELFYFNLKAEGDVFSFGVFHFGPSEETEAFKYGIKICSFEECISLTRKFHSCLEGGLKDLQPGKCVKIFYDTILDFVSESGHLSCEFEIGREKLNGFLLVEQRKSSYLVSVYGSV
jgi:Zn-finger nucleic acid-binding protein